MMLYSKIVVLCYQPIIRNEKMKRFLSKQDMFEEMVFGLITWKISKEIYFLGEFYCISVYNKDFPRIEQNKVRQRMM